jgi:hypothetical protein
MFTRNVDTGKWSNQKETLNKDYYDSLKQDLDKVKLYSKCLSGSTYLPINNLDDIYDVMKFTKIGYYPNFPGSILNPPALGPQLQIDSSNSDEIYTKYLKENAFTIKNLFTPTKLIKDQLKNYLYVDAATTVSLTNLGQQVVGLQIDDVVLLEGHRVLVKNQTTEIVLSVSVDAEEYFTNTILTSNYYEVDNDGTNITYFYYNNQNGIYEYTNNTLVKTADLDLYEDAYRYSVAVKLGTTNREKQFHLSRLKNGYYPLISENQNIEFKENHNWVLRNRVDYNNVYDINYYDIINHATQSFYDVNTGFTFSVPQRTIAVGEFGIIINNQDKLNSSFTYSNSSVISNKYKVNLRSITETTKYYWSCGDEGTILRISKVDYSIKRILIDETSNFTSISFYQDLNGLAVGDYNTIYYTNDGGLNWSKLTFSQFDNYSYNKVIYANYNQAYVAGDNGVFLELSYSLNNWIAYKRKIIKKIDEIDEVVLFEDINSMTLTNWTNIKSSSYVDDLTSVDFANNLYFNYSLMGETLQITIDNKYFSNSTFSNQSQLMIALEIEQSGSIVYTNSNFNIAPAQDTTYDFYHYIQASTTYEKLVFTCSLPLTNGNISIDSFTVSAQIFYDYDGLTDGINPGIIQSNKEFKMQPVEGSLILLASNYNNLVCYDVNSIFTPSQQQFVYASFSQNYSDLRVVERNKNTQYGYFASDKVYQFNLSDFTKLTSTVSNMISVSVSEVVDLYPNILLSSDTNLYLAGNNALLKTNDYLSSNFYELDPTFNERIKSRMVFLDYDIASKLNFFDDNGNYRVPDSITLTQSQVNLLNSGTSSFTFTSKTGELSWMDYYKDSEKTFAYYTSMNDANKVEFSTTFKFYDLTTSSDSLHRTDIVTYSNIEVNTEVSEIIKLVPSILSSTASRYFQNSTPIASNFLPTNNSSSQPYKIWAYRDILVFSQTFDITSNNIDTLPQVGDIVRLTSDVIDCNLLINRIEVFEYTTSNSTTRLRMSAGQFPPVTINTTKRYDVYMYCYSEFNETIIKNLTKSTAVISLTYLNRYTSSDTLISNLDNHFLGLAYKFEISDNDLIITPRFNNKTAYYNLQARFNLISQSSNFTSDLSYKESFLDFGYSPTYNIFDYLNKVDPDIFTSDKIFSILPEFTNLVGNDSNTFTDSNIFVDPSVGVQTGTYSWYRNGTNQLIFGSDYKNHWDSLLLHTFVDITFRSTTDGDVINTRLLITNKYYDSNLGGYVMEFHRKFELPGSFSVFELDIRSRNELLEISQDLQLLNNIQRTQKNKTVQYLNTFSTLENELKTKFSTDSYFKALVSDYSIRKYISSIIYVDYDYQLSMNILNLEKELVYNVTSVDSSSSYWNGYDEPIKGEPNRLILNIGENELQPGDLIYLISGTSSVFNLSNVLGLQTVISNEGPTKISTSKYYYSFDYLGEVDNVQVKFIKKDPFFNYQNIDLFNLGVDKNVTRSIEIMPENFKLTGSTYSLVDLDLTKYKFEFVDGLSLDEVNQNFSWLLEAEISNAVIGRDKNGLVWYSGIWRCGRWFGGTWYSGRWVSGDWYEGTWKSYNTKYKVISVEVDTSYIDNTASRWFNGRWFDGTWEGGTWYNGRRYAGDWNTGNWYNGIWNDGLWKDGNFEGGVWVQGTWEKGIFNCNSKPAYWLYGTFKSGDFENGIWYNGLFGNDQQILTRFGTKASNSRTANWHGGRWVDGEFHSFLNVDSESGETLVSDIHKYSIWRTGIWLKGKFYGGIAYNVDFRSGDWLGGILEEIQVIGVNQIYPNTSSTNSIVLNGIFKFNTGDIIWIIDDYTDQAYANLGNNENPLSYRIIQILEDSVLERTTLYLNYDLSQLGVDNTIGSIDNVGYETGLRVVSHFKGAHWYSGIWTNGIFDGDQFDSGIWYNGVFKSGSWGN